VQRRKRRPSKPIHVQLLAAFESSELTLEQLVEKAQLGCDIHSLSRKLRGKQSLRTTEAECISDALEAAIQYEPARRRVAA
jgi:hypothetical protein